MVGFNLLSWNNSFARGSINVFSFRIRVELGSVTESKWLWASCMKPTVCLVILVFVQCTWTHTEQCHHISFMSLFLDMVLFRMWSILHRNLKAPAAHTVISRPPRISFLSLFLAQRTHMFRDHPACALHKLVTLRISLLFFFWKKKYSAFFRHYVYFLFLSLPCPHHDWTG